jgi:hypothetical protein
MQEQNSGKAQMSEIIHKSGCEDIQDAIAAIEEAGFSVEDLPEETLQTVIETVASSESVGAKAGISPTDY